VHRLFLPLCVLALPLSAVSQTNSEIEAIEISKILCEDPDYLNCLYLEPETCSSTIKAFNHKCSHIFKVMSSNEEVEFDLRREITNCLIQSHVDSMSLERNRVESCYLERKGG